MSTNQPDALDALARRDRRDHLRAKANATAPTELDIAAIEDEIRAKQAQLAAASPRELAPAPELPDVALSVQAPERQGFTSFYRAGVRWDSAAPRMVRVSAEMAAVLKRERMLSVIEVDLTQAELDAMPRLELPQAQRGKVEPHAALDGAEEAGLERAAFDLELGRLLVAELVEQVDALAARLAETATEIAAAWSKYDPRDASSKALSEIEKVTGRKTAFEEQLVRQKRLLAAARSQVRAREKEHAHAWSLLQRSKWGAEGWARAHAAELERLSELSAESMRILSKIGSADAVSKFITPADVEQQAKALGVAAPTPCTPPEIGGRLAAFSTRTAQLPAVRGVLAHTAQERRAAFKSWLDELVSKAERAAGAEGKPRGERLEKVRIMLASPSCPLSAAERAEVDAELEHRAVEEAEANRQDRVHSQITTEVSAVSTAESFASASYTSGGVS